MSLVPSDVISDCNLATLKKRTRERERERERERKREIVKECVGGWV